MVNPDEASTVQVSCLRELGFAAHLSADGWSHSITLSDEQADAYHKAAYECSAQYPVRADIDRPIQGEEITMIYRHILHGFIPCAENLLGIQSIEEPSYTTYRRSIDYDGVVAIDRERMTDELFPDLPYSLRLEDECSLLPEGFRDYQR